MEKLVLHIPHSSTEIPLFDGYVVDNVILENEVLKLTDWFTDDLFYSKLDMMIIAPFSRIFCDVERFVNDNIEPMAKFGMGVTYEKTDDGLIMRKLDPMIRKKIIDNYYIKHHERLNNAVNEQLMISNKSLIIDCHSFSNSLFVRDLDKRPNRPDINIGTDPFHTPKDLLNFTIEFFKGKRYSIGINWPYSGAIVPLDYFNKNQNVHSIMIEVNRKLYLVEDTNEKSEGYCKLKIDLTSFLQSLRNI